MHGERLEAIGTTTYPDGAVALDALVPRWSRAEPTGARNQSEARVGAALEPGDRVQVEGIGVLTNEAVAGPAR